jgi:catechol 2,3-dioxygenase-like lactoylglutathione lyase family enzyme
VLLYVDDPRASAAFYSRLLGARILEDSENFVMMPLREGVLLGLWKKADVLPKVTAPAGGGELALKVEDETELARRHQELVMQKVRIAQEPTDMDFGRTFVALDADGNRLRFYASNRR